MILIVNADDFGMTASVNSGIIQGHRAGIITSTSMMVRGRAAVEAATLARASPRLGVGLHVDLCEWVYRDDQWQLQYSVVPIEDASMVTEEVTRQLDAFRTLMGCNPTHLDSHQHVHRDRTVRIVLQKAARELGIPLRHFHPRIAYCGKFYGQTDEGYRHHEAIGVDALLNILRGLPPGVTELACHPAAIADMDSIYRDERVIEFQSLCDPRVRLALAEVGAEMRSFRDFADRSDTAPAGIGQAL
jgi:chitin disaccharide deacetylase